jgi:hypothetical protein
MKEHPTMRRSALLSLLLLAACPTPSILKAQATPDTPPLGQLDPTRSIENPVLFSSFHQPLPEQYIWSRENKPEGSDNDEGKPAAVRYFRVHVHLDTVPQEATLYLAGPGSANVFINGGLAGQFTRDRYSRLKSQVFALSIAKLLQPGDNDIGIEASRGSELVAKIVPASPGVLAPALLISGPGWKVSTEHVKGWEAANFDDSSWPAVIARGGIESNIDFLQWNDDAGLYDWPGYEGVSPFLAHTYLGAVTVHDFYYGHSVMMFADTLSRQGYDPDPAHEFYVTLPPEGRYTMDDEVPYITLDFGREVTGRLQLISDSDGPITVSIAYGESLGEVNDEPYLGVDLLHLPPHGAGVGPKSAFRYARVRFLAGPHILRFKTIRLEDIYYPVHYQGSFESSDPLLNRIWETGAYTSHLCMQDDIWDAPKRDRGRWMGDTDVSGRVIDDVFADQFLIEDTLTRLIGPLPIKEHVNGIPGYSSYWFTELEHYYLHTGRKEYLSSMHDQIVGLLRFMDQDFDAQNNFINHTNEWLYVDWALDLNGATAETRAATTLEYVRAYRAGVRLLQELGDTQNADHFTQRADQLAKASQSAQFANGSFGPRWQTNAMAIISGVATTDQYASIWQNVLSNVGKPTWRPDVISPYYGSYVLDALARTGHRDAALAWIREYWGGMIKEGATSFWEAYDPAWPKDDPHVDLQADDTAGYRISLAHGWSSAPAWWLMEQVLGIYPTAAGFKETTIRPELADLDWARGAEPTPHGLIKVDMHKEGKGKENQALRATIDIPEGVEATILFPVKSGTDHIQVNGTSTSGTPTENGSRLSLHLTPGHYEIRE